MVRRQAFRIPRVLPWSALVWLCFGQCFIGEASQQRDRASQKSAPSQETRIYRIGAGDVLQILVWKEADFSGNFTVRWDGRITLPLVGDVDASGRTPPQLAGDLEEALKRFLEISQVTVTVAEPNSARYFVIGKVGKQGAFPYIGPIRVVQALALAGGFQEFAKLDKIFIIREVSGKQIYYPVDYDQLEGKRRLQVNRPLIPGDTIVVP